MSLAIRSAWIKAFCLAIIIALCAADSAPAQRRSGRKASRKSAVGKRGGKASVSRATRGGRGRKVARRGSRRGRSRYIASDNADSPRAVSSGIPTERVTEIQLALIRKGFLEGEPSGQYDAETIEAMKRFQAANQLPVTGQPSAHTLKRLGVSKTSNDGYSVPVRNASAGDQR